MDSTARSRISNFHQSLPDHSIYNSKDVTSSIFVQYYYKHYDSIQKFITNNNLSSKKVKPVNKNSLSYIRLLHASPETPQVEVYIDGVKYFTKFNYKDATVYIPVSSGSHIIDLFATGETSKQILSKSITIQSNHFYTIAANGKLNDLTLLSCIDNTFLPSGETKIRLIHLATNTQNLDLAVKQGEGDVVFSNVKCHGISEYLALTPMTVNLEIRKTGTKSIAYHLYKSKFEENKLYNIIVVDSLNEKYGIEVFNIN